MHRLVKERLNPLENSKSPSKKIELLKGAKNDETENEAMKVRE